MCLVAFNGFFSFGELTADGAHLKPLLQIGDLHFPFKKNFVTSASIIANFKHDTNTRPF